MLYLNLTIDSVATRLKCQRIVPLICIFLAVTLSTGCSKQSETTAENVTPVSQTDSELMATVENVPSASQTDSDLMASGQWRDPDTGLIWMRCSMGQKWTGSTCSGVPIKFNWQDANEYFQLFNMDGFAGSKNWQLPEIEELVTLRRCSNDWVPEIKTIGNLTRNMGIRQTTLPNGRSVPLWCADGSRRPTLDILIFPNTPEDWYWSASDAGVVEYAGYVNLNYAWYVNFGNGYAGYGDASYGNKNIDYYVRAVRTGQ
jgi:hypothetical protein